MDPTFETNHLTDEDIAILQPFLDGTQTDTDREAMKVYHATFETNHLTDEDIAILQPFLDGTQTDTDREAMMVYHATFMIEFLKTTMENREEDPVQRARLNQFSDILRSRNEYLAKR
jgi:predicted nucleotide-binding protein (sugar kinase/HSP70/actin superfamily)